MSVLIYKNHNICKNIAIAGVMAVLCSNIVISGNIDDKTGQSIAVELTSRYEDLKFRMIRLEKQHQEIAELRTDVNKAYRNRRLYAEALNKQARALIKPKGRALRTKFLLAYHQFCISNSNAVYHSDRFIARLASCQRLIKSLIENVNQLEYEINTASKNVKNYRSIKTTRKLLVKYKNDLNIKKRTTTDLLMRAHIASIHHIKKAWKLYCGVRQKFFAHSRQLKSLPSGLNEISLVDRGNVTNETINRAIRF